MKKIILLAALLLCAAILFAACDAKPEESETSVSSQVSQAPESQSSESSEDSSYSSLVSNVLEEEGEITDLVLVQLPEGTETHVYRGSSLLKGQVFELDPDLDGDSIREIFRVARDMPSGLKVLASYEQRGQNLAALLTLPEAFDEEKDLLENWYVQLSFYDLDGSGEPDILVSVGDGSTVSETALVLFDAHTSQHFTHIGSISGAHPLTVEGPVLTDGEGNQYEVKERQLYQLTDGSYEEVLPTVTDEILVEEITRLIEPLAITGPENFAHPSELNGDVLLNTVLFSYILRSDPSTRIYENSNVCIPVEDADKQCTLLFGDQITLDPEDYGKKSEEQMVYYDAEIDCYIMPSAGFFYDYPRVDKLEQNDTGYRATVSFLQINPNMGLDPDMDLSDLPVSRVVVYDFMGEPGSLVVTALENQEQNAPENQEQE